jgi:large subunit ribosomal protein L4
MSVSTYTKSGAKATTPAKLDASVFDIVANNHELLKLAYTSYLANGRDNLAVVKTRGLVSGGGRKPWKQKGTGRARFGSSRNPIWRGGGIVFGPTGEENYSKKLSTTTRRQALRQALTLAAKSDKIKVIEAFDFKNGKVSDTSKLLSKVEASGRILLVVSAKDEFSDRATRNLQNVSVVSANYTNVYDVMNADTIVITKDALEVITTWLGGNA